MVNIRKRLKHFFLLSNQLPFYVFESIKTNREYPDSTLKSELQKPILRYIDSAKTKYSHPIQLISFYDPNDAFGYRLPIPTAKKTDKQLNISNIRLYNTLRWTLHPIKAETF